MTSESAEIITSQSVSLNKILPLISDILDGKYYLLDNNSGLRHSHDCGLCSCVGGYCSCNRNVSMTEFSENNESLSIGELQEKRLIQLRKELKNLHTVNLTETVLKSAEE